MRGLIGRNQTPSARRTAFADVGGVAVGELREIGFERRSRDASRISPLMKRQPEEDVLAHLMREAIRGHHPRSSSEVIIRGCSRAPDEGGNQRSSSEVIIRGHQQRCSRAPDEGGNQRSSSAVIIRGHHQRSSAEDVLAHRLAHQKGRLGHVRTAARATDVAEVGGACAREHGEERALTCAN
jgi:hypothetical protein